MNSESEMSLIQINWFHNYFISGILTRILIAAQCAFLTIATLNWTPSEFSSVCTKILWWLWNVWFEAVNANGLSLLRKKLDIVTSLPQYLHKMNSVKQTIHRCEISTLYELKRRFTYLLLMFRFPTNQLNVKMLVRTM